MTKNIKMDLQIEEKYQRVKFIFLHASLRKNKTGLRLSKNRLWNSASIALFKTILWCNVIPKRMRFPLQYRNISLFFLETRWGKGSFWIEVLTLVQNISENRIRHARVPVHLHLIRYMHTFIFTLKKITWMI